MTKLRATLTIVALLISSSVQAEIFQGIKHGYSLGKVKTLFPLADIKPVAAAWVTKDDGFYKISGQGFPGTVYIAFNDYRPSYKTLEAEAKASESLDTAAADVEPMSKKWGALAQQSTDEALSVRWVRWVPESQIPIQRYISKYGKPDKTGFKDSDMQPYASWTKKGIFANLSDNEKFVNNVEFDFTKQEKIDACQERTIRQNWARACKFED